jgi:hypothetical protein
MVGFQFAYHNSLLLIRFPVLVVVSCLQQNKQGFQIYYTNILKSTRKRLHHFMNDDLYQVKKIR